MTTDELLSSPKKSANEPWVPRAQGLYDRHIDRLNCWMDRSMAALLIVQWLFQIALAVWVSPLTWAGLQSSIHPHVWTAVGLGGLAISVPLALIYFRPGRRSTRLSIAAAQGLTTAILIHLTGGRIETHFYVFVSLALLAFYRDWAVLVTMSAMVAIDHFTRGFLWPQSVYGVTLASPLRVVEHVCWVVMEDLYLWMICRQSLREAWSTAAREAQLELANDEMGTVNQKLRDEITERQRAQKELETAKNSAEAASRAKSEFLANMSHELRTPLNSVIGFSDVLAEKVFGPLNEDQEQYVSDILDSGQHLLSLVNDILDLAKIEAGSMELSLAPVDLRRLVERTTQMFRERAIRSGVRLTGHVDPAIGHITADERRLKQLLYNLLSNALKFTPEHGEVRVEARRHGDDIELLVVDTGVGISPEQHDKIFQSFYQVDSTLSKHVQGTGLGLAVVQQIVSLHGGSVRLESEPGEGCTFFVLLPQASVDSDTVCPVVPSEEPVDDVEMK